MNKYVLLSLIVYIIYAQNSINCAESNQRTLELNKYKFSIEKTSGDIANIRESYVKEITTGTHSIPQEEKQLISHVADFYVFTYKILVSVNNRDGDIRTTHVKMLLKELRDALNEDIFDSKEPTDQPNNTGASASNKTINLKDFYTFIKTKSEQYSTVIHNNNESATNNFAIVLIEDLAKILYAIYEDSDQKDLFSCESTVFLEHKTFTKHLNLKSSGLRTRLGLDQVVKGGNNTNNKSPYDEPSLKYTSFWDKNFFTRILINSDANELSQEKMELISHVADFYEFLGAIFTKTNAKSAISSPHFQFLLERLIYALKEDICQSKQFTYESNNTKSNTEDQNWAFKKFYTFIRTISNKYGQSNVNDFASKFMQNLGEILLEKYKNPEKQKLFSLEFLQQTKEEDYKDLLDLKSHAKEFNIAKIPQQGTQIQTGQSFQSNKPKNQSVVHDPLSYKSPYCQHSVHLMFSSFWDKDFFTRIFINPNANEISKEETELISHVADFYEFLGAIFTNANKTSRVSLYRMQELLDLLRYALNEDICQPKKFTYSLAHPARHLSFFVCLIERTYQFLFRCLATGSSLYQSNNTKSIDYNSRFKEFYTFIKTISNKYSGNDRPNDFANTFMQTLAKILLEKYMSPIEKTLFSWKTFSESKPENFKKLLDLKSHAKKFNIPKSKSTDKTKKNNDNDSFPFAAIGLILFFIYLLIHENF